MALQSLFSLVTEGIFCESYRLVAVEGIEGVVESMDFLTASVELYEPVQGALEEMGDSVAVAELGEDLTAEIEDPTAVIGEIESVVVKEVPEPEPFSIDSFSTTVGTQEVGASVVTPAFTASYSDTPTLVVLTDSEGTPPKDVTATPDAFSSDGTFQKNGNNQAVTFTLTADRGAEQDTAQTSITWRPRTYWGIGGASLLSEAEIEALAGSQLDNNYNHTFTIGPMGPAEYVWYCFPQSYDPGDGAQFQVGPFVGGFFKAGVVSVTNAYGVVQDYACWRSDFPGLDEITVTVF